MIGFHFVAHFNLCFHFFFQREVERCEPVEPEFIWLVLTLGSLEQVDKEYEDLEETLYGETVKEDSLLSMLSGHDVVLEGVMESVLEKLKKKNGIFPGTEDRINKSVSRFFHEVLFFHIFLNSLNI